MDKNIDNYCDKSFESFNKRVNVNSKYQYELTKINGENIITLYDVESHKSVLQAEYEIAGIYNNINNMWYWAWAQIVYDKSSIIDKKKIRRFADNIMNEYDNSDILYFYYYLTTTNSLFINTDKLNDIAKLAIYIFNYIWFVYVVDSENVMFKLDQNISNKNIKILIIKKILST